MTNYYLPKDGINPDTIYGGNPVVCISESEIRRLSAEWGTDVMAQMRPATEDELNEFGIACD